MKPIETVDKCTTCSTCVAYCPVTRATRAFKGPKLTGPSSERFRLLDETGGGEVSEIEALDYCSNCKNCDIACPSGVKISTLNMLARADFCRTHKPPLRDWVLAHGGKLGELARRFPHWLVRLGATNPLSRAALDLFGVDKRAPMPVFAPESFTTLLDRHNATHTPRERQRLTKKVIFFPGCYINDYEPQTGLDLVFLLEKAGYEVLSPAFQCCGVPLVANGFLDDAHANACTNTNIFLSLPDVPILTLCPSCQLMLKQEYGELFPDLTAFHALVPRVQDACEFLIGLVEADELNLELREDATPLVYHAPCHLRAQGTGKPGFDFLRMVPGIAIEDARGGCCGISGSYGFKKEKYDVATAVGSELFQTIKDSKATVCVTDCGTCRLQIAHHTGLAAVHPVSWIRKLVRE